MYCIRTFPDGPIYKMSHVTHSFETCKLYLCSLPIEIRRKARKEKAFIPVDGGQLAPPDLPTEGIEERMVI